MPSGTYGFNLTLNEIVEEAFDRCGMVVRNAHDYRTARRSLDLLLAEWSNAGTNFFLLQENTTTLTAGDGVHTLDSQVQDIIEIYTRENAGLAAQNDLPIRRIGVSDWASLPNKGSEGGRPTNVWVEKARDALVLHFWPVPSVAIQIVWHELRRAQDTGTDASDTVDIAYRFLPALVAGLAVKIAAKRAPDRVSMLEMDYRKAWDDAQSAERERRPTKLYPNMRMYRR